MWALVESGSISKIYIQPKAITIGDIKYPRNIFEHYKVLLSSGYNPILSLTILVLLFSSASLPDADEAIE